jgi:hypothetical protein
MSKFKKLNNNDCRGVPRFYKKAGGSKIIIQGKSRYWRQSPEMIDFESGPALFKGSAIYDGKKDLGVIKDFKIVSYSSSEISEFTEELCKLIVKKYEISDAEKERALKFSIMGNITSFLSEWLCVEIEMESDNGKS